MYCQHCGREVKDNDIFCPSCGEKLELEINQYTNICPHCGYQIPSTIKKHHSIKSK